jgi:hypothetical protein
LALERDHHSFRYLDYKFRSNKKFIIDNAKFIFSCPNNIIYISYDLRYDKNFILSIIKYESSRCEYWDCNASSTLKHLNETLQDDIEVIEKYLKYNKLAFKFASNNIKANKTFVMKFMDGCSDSFQFADKSFKDNKEFVLFAILKNPYLLQFVSERLKDNNKIVETAVSLRGSTLEFASKRLQDNYIIVELAVSNNGDSIQYASSRLQHDKNIVLKAINNGSCETLDYISPDLKLDLDVLLIHLKYVNEYHIREKLYFINLTTEYQNRLFKKINNMSKKERKKYKSLYLCLPYLIS